ncbi:hypothetical protein [Pseudoalteromonas luteoviolacea]|nr:hypothetical protein [Pseudoalteromonas luteoviolacea]
MKLKLTKTKIKELSNNKKLTKEQTHAIGGGNTIGQSGEVKCQYY